MSRKTLSDKGVAALKPRAARYAFADPELRGHYVRVQPNGAKSFATVARTPSGKQVWTTIGAADALGIEEAREQAREAIKRIRTGLPAIPAQAATFGDVAASWRKRHVEANGLRTASRIGRLLDKHVLPEWREREFTSIRRSEITALLDKVEDGHGARQADVILTIIRSLCNWYAARHDDYAVPTVRGMTRQSAAARARARVLDDDELRALWQVSETGGGPLGAMVRLALLTAQRRAKIVTMRWADISDRWRMDDPERAAREACGRRAGLAKAGARYRPRAVADGRQSLCVCCHPRQRPVCWPLETKAGARRQVAERHRAMDASRSAAHRPLAHEPRRHFV